MATIVRVSDVRLHRALFCHSLFLPLSLPLHTSLTLFHIHCKLKWTPCVLSVASVYRGYLNGLHLVHWCDLLQLNNLSYLLVSAHGIQGWWWGKVRVWEAEDPCHCTQLVVVDTRSPWRFAAHLQIVSGAVQSAVVLCLGGLGSMSSLSLPHYQFSMVL